MKRTVLLCGLIVLATLLVASLGVVGVSAQTSTDCASCHPKYPSDSFDQYSNTNPVSLVGTCWPCHGMMLNHGGLDGARIDTPYGAFFSLESINLANPATIAKIHAKHKDTNPYPLNPEYGCNDCHAGAACTTCHGTGVPHGNHTVLAGGGNNYPGIAETYAIGKRGTVPPYQYTATLTCTNGSCHGSMNTSFIGRPSCLNCHMVDKDGHGDLTELHTATESQECVDCHVTGDVRDLHPACETCHSTSVVGKTTECISCHAYSPIDPNHYNETTHTATPFTAAAQGGTFEAGGKECILCHSATLKAAHVTGSVHGGPVGCVQCHTDETRNSVAVIADDWSTRKCVQCHDYGVPKTHATYSTVHVVTSGSCAGSGTGCHEDTDLAQLHDKSQPGGTPKYDSCTNAGCHSVRDTRPASLATPDSCGSSSGGCHTDKTPTNHGGDHSYSAASNYTDGATHEGNEVGCANSGAGCHGTDTTYADMRALYNHIGCTTGPCHMSADKPSVIAPLDCAKCHNGNYQNAPDRIELYDAYPNGHYNVTTHTATAMTRAVSADGSASAQCAACHDTAMRSAHTAIGTTNYGTKVTCGECHNDTLSNGAAQVAANWTNDRCEDCHTLSASAPMHSATTAPARNGTSSLGCGASGTGCHTTYNLHVLHKDAASCGLAGCHDAAHKNIKPTLISCGEGNACHTDKTPTNHGGTHDLDVTGSNYNNTTVTGCTNSGAGCHGADTEANYQPYHPNSGCTAGPCHTSVDKATHRNPLTCQTCHDNTYANAAAVSKLTSTTAAGGHYSETSHTPTAASVTTSVTAGGTVSARCNQCHNNVPATGLKQLYAQHNNLANGYGNTTCSECHNLNTSVTNEITSKWSTKRCDACHKLGVMPANVQHATVAPAVTGTSASGCGASGTGCHNTYDLHVLHKGSANSTAAIKANGCAISGCHDYTKQAFKPTKKSCGTGGDCHTAVSPIDPNHYDKAKHTGTDGPDCADCHYLELKPEHAKPTSGLLNCVACHTSTQFANLAKPWNKACAGCHSTKHTATAQKHRSTQTACAGTGCHVIGDVATLHSNATTTTPSGTLTGCRVCHQSAAAVPTTTNCIVCHPTAHAMIGAHQGIACSTCHPTSSSPSVTNTVPADEALWIQNLSSTTAADTAGSKTTVTSTMSDGKFTTAYAVQAGTSAKVLTMRLSADTRTYSKVVLRLYINSFNSSGANVRIYPYAANGTSVNTSAYSTTRVNRTGWKDFDVTTPARTMDGFGFTKFRVTTTDNSFTVSEGQFTVTTVGPLKEEAICYQCHNNPANSKNGVNVQSQFTVGTATWTGQGSKGYYTKVNTRHDISDADQAWSLTKLECTNCHSGHLATRTLMLVDPDNRRTTQWTATRIDPRQGAVVDSIAFCLRCHDNTWAADGSVTGPAAIRNIAQAYASDQHGDAEGNRGTKYLNGWFEKYPRMLCTDCHDAHGGGGLYHLKTLTDRYGKAITITDADSHDVAHWCSHCHDNPMNQLDGSKDGCISRSCHIHGTSSF